MSNQVVLLYDANSNPVVVDSHGSIKVTQVDATGTQITSANPMQVIVQTDPNNPPQFNPQALRPDYDTVSIGQRSGQGTLSPSYRNTGLFPSPAGTSTSCPILNNGGLGGAGTCYGIQIVNYSGAPAYVAFFDSINPTPGTTLIWKEFFVESYKDKIWAAPSMGVNFTTGLTVFSSPIENGVIGSAAGIQISVDVSH